MADPYEYAPNIVLNKQKRHEDGRILPISIFGSNSKQGTAIYVKPINTLFDIGINYQKVQSLNDVIDVIMVSHAHSDHLNWSTLVSMIKAHPMIVVLVPYFVEIPSAYAYLSRNIMKVHDNTELTLRLRTGQSIKVMPLEMPHGNEKSFSYSIEYENAGLLFSTDLSSTSHLPQLKKYSIIMIETNYDADEFISENGTGGATAHLSVQDAMKYAIAHLDDYGKIIPLHFGPTMVNYNQLH